MDIRTLDDLAPNVKELIHTSIGKAVKHSHDCWIEISNDINAIAGLHPKDIFAVYFNFILYFHANMLGSLDMNSIEKPGIPALGTMAIQSIIKMLKHPNPEKLN
jgi:hypothetical protein